MARGSSELGIDDMAQHSVTSKRLRLLLLPALLTAMLLVRVAPASASHAVPVTVTITSVTAIGDDLEDLRGDEDLYAGVRIGGVLKDSFAIHTDGDGDIQPFWAFTVPVTGENVDTPVSIEIWEHDDCDHPFCNDTGTFESNDDKADVDPGGDDDVNLSLKLADSRWTGDRPWPGNCSEGTGGNAARVCWDIAVGGSDSDGDGLLDGWELNGFNADNDNTIDVNLPAFGANPLRKDLFLELDTTTGQTPGRDDIQAMKRAMAVAPLSNPVGPNGVNLWVDTGGLVDPTAREGQVAGTCTDGIDNGGDGQTDGADPNCANTSGNRQYLDSSVEDPGPGTCSDGVSNDGDGLVDGADPDCLVGDNLGGGNTVAALNNCGIDGTFYATKNAPGNFAAARRSIFRYAISTSSDPDTDGNGPDTGCGSGGQGEIGGNDFIEYNHDGGTILHELGHNLNIHHGGSDDRNCKPNLVSNMNYDLQFGIPRVGGGAILDYSPPRIAITGASRGSAPITQLKENALNETVALDVNDNLNRFVFVDRTGQKRTTTLNAGPDWDGDGTGGDASDNNVQANIDTSSPPPASNPSACTNNTNTDTLNGNHDWNRVSLPFRGFGDSADGAVNPELEQVPTIPQSDQMLAELNKADVGVTIADTPDPVAAGETLTWTLSAANHGPNPATSVEVSTTLPADVTFVDSSVPCVRAGTTVRCNVGELAVGASRTYTIRASVPADLVYRNGGPKTITASAAVDNLAGPDPQAANDTASESTLVVAKADVKITGASATGPIEVLMGRPTSASLSVTVENGGPSSPVDAVVTTEGTADSGVVVTPATTVSDATALAVGSPRTVASTATLNCVSPGAKTVTLKSKVGLKNPADVDPDLTNNQRTTSFQIDCVVPIAINVRPGGFPNSINLNTDANMAALTTRAGEYGLPLDFDATAIDVLSSRWGLRSNLFNVTTPTGAIEIHGKGHPERSYELDERTVDPDVDLVLHFKPSASGLNADTTEGCLKGRYRAPDGNTYTFLGCDSVRIVPPKK